MNKHISEQVLQEKVAALPDEMSPERDLWSGIERAIQQGASGKAKAYKPFVPLTLAASFVVAILVSWVTFSPQMQNPAVIDLVSSMQQDFDKEKKLMLVSLGQPKLSELPENMQEQLDQLARARQSIEAALADDPNNLELMNLLRWTQAQELNLIEKLYTPQWQTI